MIRVVVRINRYIASSTVLSRRAADQAIEDGRVTVNGSVVSTGQMIIETDHVLLDGIIIKPSAAFTYLIFNKPKGAIVSRAHQGGSKTIYDYLPEEYENLNPVGRLDKDSSGLLLMSDDGDFIQQASHPSYAKTKIYILRLNRVITKNDIDLLNAGVMLEDGLSSPQVQSVDRNIITLSLMEGRNRQLRRTMSALGYEVEALHRTQFGSILLGALKPGEYIKPVEKPSL